MTTDHHVIREKIEGLIAKDHKLGASSGGSGHLGHTSFILDNLEISENEERFDVSYVYTVFIETEFTYYPDNPPYETQYRKKLMLDGELNVLSEEEVEVLRSNFLP